MALPAITSTGQVAGVQLGGAITPQTAANAMGGAQAAIGTGVQDASLRSNAIAGMARESSDLFDRVGKTATMMADVGATIGKYLEDKSIRDEAAVLAPLKGVTSAFGYEKIARGDFSGFTDIAVSSSIGGGNPLLARMGQESTAIANNLADNYVRTTVAAQDQAFREKLYGMQQDGRTDLLNDRQAVTAGNNAEAEAAARASGMGGGGTPQPQGQPAPQPQQQPQPDASIAPEDQPVVEAPLPDPASQEPDSNQQQQQPELTDQQLLKGLSVNTEGMSEDEQAIASTQAKAALTNTSPQTARLDDADQKLYSALDWANRSAVSNVLKNMPPVRAARMLAVAAKDSNISPQDAQEYIKQISGGTLDINEKLKSAGQIAQASARVYPTSTEAVKVADKNGMMTPTWTDDQFELFGAVPAYATPDNKAGKFSTTKSLTRGPGGTSFTESQTQSAPEGKDSGLPDYIIKPLTEATNAVRYIESDGQVADFIKSHGGITGEYTPDGSVRSKVFVEDSAGTANASAKLYAVDDNGKRVDFDRDISPKMADAVRGSLSASQELANNPSTKTFFLMVDKKNQKFKSDLPPGLTQETADNYKKLGVDETMTRKNWEASGGSKKKFAELQDQSQTEVVDRKFEQYKAAAQGDNATETDLKRFQGVKTAKITLMEKKREDLNRDLQRALKTKDVSIFLAPGRPQIPTGMSGSDFTKAKEIAQQMNDLDKELFAIKDM